MKENSIIFIGAGKCSQWVSTQTNLNVLGFYDIDESKSTFKSIDEIVEADADIYAICTPSDDHIKTFCKIAPLLENKIITIEKPIFLKMSDFSDAQYYIDKCNHTVYPIFQHRYNKAIQYTKNAIDTNKIGDILHGQLRFTICRPQKYYDLADWRGTWKSDGGVLTNQGIHAIDLVRYLFGEITEVLFEMDTAGVDIECEDTACGILKTSSGRLINVAMTTTARNIKDIYNADLSIYGSNGYITIGNTDICQFSTITRTSLEHENEWMEQQQSSYGNGHKILYDRICNGGKILSTLDDAKETMRLIHNAYLSAYGSDLLGV